MRIFKKKGDDILSHLVAVPSALIGLTSLFGMGRGEPYRYNHLKSFVSRWYIRYWYLLYTITNLYF